MWTYNTDYLSHHGILGQKWGVRRFQNPDGSLTPAGKKRYSGETLFVSGSSKTQTKDSGYYRSKLPKGVRKELNKSIKDGDKIIVGDAPGIDRQVQDYLNKKKYENVEIYGPGNKQVRYSANPKWKTNLIDAPQYEEGTDEWRAEKDKAMSKAATKGLAVIIDKGGAGATRNNINRMMNEGKNVEVYKLYNNEKKIKDKNMTDAMKIYRENKKDIAKLVEKEYAAEEKERLAQNNPSVSEKQYADIYNNWKKAESETQKYISQLTNKMINDSKASYDKYFYDRSKRGKEWFDIYSTILEESYK